VVGGLSSRGGFVGGGSKDAVIEDDVEFRGAGGDGGAGFFELGERVLGAFVEADDAGDEDVGAFEVGDAAGDPVEADAYALRGELETVIPMK
jgi:hypothetical protein